MVTYVFRFSTALLLILASTGASALTGDDLLRQCSKPVVSVEWKQCGSYVLGVVGGANMLMLSMKQLHPESSNYPLLFCVQPSVPMKDLVDVVVNFLSKNVSGRRYDAASEVMLALEESFPCGND